MLHLPASLYGCIVIRPALLLSYHVASEFEPSEVLAFLSTKFILLIMSSLSYLDSPVSPWTWHVPLSILRRNGIATLDLIQSHLLL